MQAREIRRASHQEVKTCEVPKIGDPNRVPSMMRSLLQGTQNELSLIFGNSQILKPLSTQLLGEIGPQFLRGLLLLSDSLYRFGGSDPSDF